MKPSLVVLTPGKQEGKVVSIPAAEFHIGRDPQCQLRPTNPIISKRHCALIVRDEALIVRDLKSTNGTFVNDERVEGERELAEGDQLKIGPLLFGVRLGKPPGVDRPTPLPPTKSAPPSAVEDLEAVAAELLSLNDEPAPVVPVGEEPAEPGSTTLLLTSPSLMSGAVADVPGLAAAVRDQPAGKKPTPSGDTSSAAKDLLDKYLRRNKAR
jgi:predicted component of type VI protein secretion system